MNIPKQLLIKHVGKKNANKWLNMVKVMLKENESDTLILRVAKTE